MVSVPVPEQLLAQAKGGRHVPPLGGEAAQLVAAVHDPRRLGVDLEECGVEGRRVAAMAVDEEEPAEPVSSEGEHHVPHHGHEGHGPQGDRSWEGHVVLGHTHREGGGDGRPCQLGGSPRQGLGADGVGADEPGGAVLLGGADGHDDAFRILQIPLHLRPGHELQSHGHSLGVPGAGARCGLLRTNHTKAAVTRWS